jgi:SAM-dependent methyltransferase
MTDPGAVERDLAAFYNQEEGRADRALDPERVAARAAFIDQVDAGVRVLEIGTGPGRDVAAFVEAGLATIGVDLALKYAGRVAALGAGAANASARALPFAASSFGALWSMSTLMHVPNSAIKSALREVHRVLKPGGVAAIGVWGGRDVEDRSDEDSSVPRLFSRRTDDTWQSLLTIIGPIEHYDTWSPWPEGDGWYQFAIVRAS